MSQSKCVLYNKTSMQYFKIISSTVSEISELTAHGSRRTQTDAVSLLVLRHKGIKNYNSPAY